MLEPVFHKHLCWMADLETLATNNMAVVPEISLVAFEIDTGKIVTQHTIRISVDEQLAQGRTVSSGTLSFWLQQSEEARGKLLLSMDSYCKDNNLPEPLSINEALTKITRIVEKDTVIWETVNAQKLEGRVLDKRKPRPLIWGNGARFDCGKIADLYEKAGKEQEYPWGYAGDCDVRTLHALAPEHKYNEVFEGIPHYGLDDCKFQISYVSKIYADILDAAVWQKANKK